MEIRNVNIIFSKNGNGFTTNKVSIPVPFIEELGFNLNDKQAIILKKNNEIIIRKKEKNMLLIKNQNVKWVSSKADYELENGVLLFEEDWNGELYRNGFDPKAEKDTNRYYRAIYEEVEPDEFEIIGFEEE